MSNKILVIIKKIQDTGNLISIDNSIKSFEAIVGGNMEVALIRDDLAVICNKDYANPYSKSIIFTGYENNSFISLNEEQLFFLEVNGLLNADKTAKPVQDDINLLEFAVGKTNPLFDNLNNEISVLFTESGFIFNVVLDNIVSHEIKALKNNIKISLAYKDDIIFFLLEIDDLLCTSDIAFTIHMCPPECKSIEDLQEGIGYSCNIVLTEANNGEIKAMRMISLNSDTSNKLNKYMKDQLNKPFDKSLYAQKIAKIQRAYTPDELLRFSTACSEFKRNTHA